MRDRSLERRHLTLAVLGASAALTALAWPALQGRVDVFDDLGIFHLPLRAFYARSLARGDSFLWFPEVFGGFYVHGEGQAGMLHPLHLLLYAALPLVVAFNLELVLSYVGLLGGTYVFLRRWDLPRDAAAFGALVFAFSGFNLLHFIHPNMVGVVAHAPWLLASIEVALCGPDPRRAATARLAVGLLTASQMLLGHPHAVFLSAVLEAAYVLFRVRAGRGLGSLASLGAAKVLGVLAGAVQLLPTWEVVADSTRARPAEGWAYRHSLHPANLLQVVSPYLARARAFGTRYPHEFGLYGGAATTALLAWLLARRRALATRRSLATVALLLSAAGLVLALGRYGLLYGVQAHLPLLRLLENPARYAVLVHFAWAVAAAVAFADLAEISASTAGGARPRLRPLGLLVALGVATAAVSLVVKLRPETFPAASSALASPAAILLGAGLLASAAGLVAAAARGWSPALGALVVFAAVDQTAYGLTYLRGRLPPVELSRFVEGQALPPESSPHRAQSDNNILTMSGVRLAGGYAAFRPKREIDVRTENRLRVAGVRWVQARTPWASDSASPAPLLDGEVQRVTHDALGRPSIWRQVSRPMPRAWLVSQDVVSTAPNDDLASLDLESAALVPEALGLGGGPPGTAAVTSDRPGALRLEVESPSRQLVVLSESWHRGWRAWVDGQARPTVRVNGDFVGCVVESGRHEVEMLFRPRSFTLGAGVSVAALLALVSAWVVERARRRAGPGR